MDIEKINEETKKENKGVIFVCKYCGDLFWSDDERNNHRENCKQKNIIYFNHSN